MRLFACFLISAAALAQTPLIGVNSSAAAVPANAPDVVASITVDPSPAGGDLLAVMLTEDGILIRIELPDGRSITKETASSAGFTWQVSGQGQGDMLLIPGLQGKVNHLLALPPKAPAGKYLIHADATNVKQDSAVMLMFLPLGDLGATRAGQRSIVRVALTATGMFHYAGDKVQLLAGVFDGNRGVNDAQLTAVAVAEDEHGMPQGDRMPVIFQSSGPGPDGNYHAELPTTAAGKYEIALKVEGKYPDGTEFERGAATSVDIKPRRAWVLGVTEQPVDEDGNALIDRIDLTASVKVEMPGEYYLTLDLKASSGKYMQAYGKAELGVGVGTMTATLGRYSLTHIGADGPYKISARLFRKEGAGQAFASLLEDAGVTRPYKQSIFDRGPIYFLGTAKATPVSPTATGAFGQLSVSLDVFTPGGACSWFGGLLSGRTNIEFVNNHGVLPKGIGQITFPFDGYRISDAADGKPLAVANVGILCGPQGAHPEKSISLPAFGAGTFVKAAPSFEFGTMQLTVPMQHGKVATVYLEIATQGGFDQTLDLELDGLPEGIITQDFPLNWPARQLVGLMFHLTADATVPLGQYPVTVRAKYKTMERSKALTLAVFQ